MTGRKIQPHSKTVSSSEDNKQIGAGKKELETPVKSEGAPNEAQKDNVEVEQSSREMNKNVQPARPGEKKMKLVKKDAKISRNRFMIPFVSLLVVLVAVLCNSQGIKGRANFMLMRLFRDLSRSKAHARLHNSSSALLPLTVMLGREEPLHIPEPDDATPVFSSEELAFYRGVIEPLAPLYLSIRGRVYDVSKGHQYYGPGRSYHAFTGKDATRAFATGCLDPACMVSSLEGLNSQQLREVDRWVELYEHHDRYTFVGVLRSSPVQDVVDRALEEQIIPDRLKGLEVKQLSALGAQPYSQGNYEEAKAYWNAALVRLGEESSAAESGGKSEERGVILLSLAAVAQKQGHIEQAQHHALEAIEGLESWLAEDVRQTHPLLARAHADCGVFHFLQDKNEEAQSGLRQAVGIYERALATAPASSREGVQPILELANTRFNLARVLLSSSELQTADQVLAELGGDLSGLPKTNPQVLNLRERADRLREEVENEILKLTSEDKK